MELILRRVSQPREVLVFVARAGDHEPWGTLPETILKALTKLNWSLFAVRRLIPWLSQPGQIPERDPYQKVDPNQRSQEDEGKNLHFDFPLQEANPRED